MLQFQQRIALFYGATGFSRDSGIVISIADNERRGHGIAFGLNGFQFKADQRLTFLHLVTLVDEVGKVLATQLDRIDADVHQQFGTELSGKASILGGVILIGIGLEIFISGVFCA